MTAETDRTGHGWTVRIGGPWISGDAGILKDLLEGLPQDPVPLGVDLTGQEMPPLAVIQVLWAYLRYARGFQRRVSVRLDAATKEEAVAWGLLGSGWEGYFHAG